MAQTVRWRDVIVGDLRELNLGGSWYELNKIGWHGDTPCILPAPSRHHQRKRFIARVVALSGEVVT